MRKVSAVIVAAGSGKRFGSAKQFVLLRGQSVLERSLGALGAHPEVDEIVLVLPAGEGGAKYRKRFAKVIAVVRGGEKRQDSVVHGFKRLDSGPADIILVHDAVRPLVSGEGITRGIAKARECGAAIAAGPVEDTIKEAAGGVVVRTLERENLPRG